MNPLDLTGRSRLMIFCPHPDDETLAAGGLIQQAVAARAAVRVVFVTDGERNPWPQRCIERRVRIGSAERARWSPRRRGEAVAALSRLGVDAAEARFLGFPDQGLTQLLLAGGDEVIGALAEEIALWRPSLLVAPSERDLHPDHNALAVLTRFALSRLSPDVPPPTLAAYVVHGRHLIDSSIPGWEVRLRPEEIAGKRDAIRCHATQLVLSGGRFLSYARDREIFLAPGAAVSRGDRHPVLRTSVTEGALRIDLAGGGGSGLIFPATLYLVTEGGPRGPLRLAIPWPRVTRGADVRDLATGAVISRGVIGGAKGAGQMAIPLPRALDSRCAFVKLSTWTVFFDRSGWREIDTIPALADRPALSERRPTSCCVIPGYNVEGACGEVVRRAAQHADSVIAVDDGSTDGTGGILRRISEESGGRVSVLSFSRNRGKGVALLEAFRRALADQPFDVLVTLDGDGQHRPEDIPRLARRCLEEGFSLVIGERRETSAMPFASRLGNGLTRTILRAIYPASPFDTQSGLRAHERGFLEEVVRVARGGRYETELDILLLALRQGRGIGTVPVQTLYFDRNRASHFRPIADSMRIFRALLGSRSLPRIASRAD